jgi:O-antigen ligase
MPQPALRLPLAICAAALPPLLAFNVSPSPTFLNQALAIALWGWFIVAGAGTLRAVRGAWPVLAALGVMGLAVAASWAHALPGSLALSALGLLAAAVVMAAAAAAAHSRDDAPEAFGDFCVGFAIGGALNVAIAAVQIFAPDWNDPRWLAASGTPGRAVGNLRQPNHLSSLLLFSAVAVVALLELRRLRARWAVPLFALLVVAVVWTASRTGLVGVVLLALWGLADRRLSPRARALLIAAPLVYAAAWIAMAGWARATAHAFGGSARLAETDISASRFGIWSNTLKLIAENPGFGVGFGEFNFAWTLTPFPGRPVAFFDHTHNVVLQLAVEIGLVGGAIVVGLLVVALVRGGVRAWRAEGDGGSARRAALMMVLMIGLHSQLEYPLWYAYFLLPTAWAFGFVLGGAPPAAAAARPPAAVPVGGIVLAIGAMLSVLDYIPITRIFSADDAAPLDQRIARGQRSVFFAHHADYAAATVYVERADLTPYRRATHYLLDTRIMIAWSKTLAARGRVDEARFLVDRLREFRNADADAFFAVCKTDAAAFQCQPAQASYPWRALVPR